MIAVVTGSNGFVLEKAKEQLKYHPKSFNDALAHIDKQLTNQNN